MKYLSLICGLLFCSSGCAALAVAGNAIPVTVHARYAGLANHSAGIMVWADKGVLIDWGTLQIDLATAVQNKLQTAKTEETKGVSWPWPPQSIVKYVRDHPAVESDPAVEIAPRLQVQRLIYVEVQQFRTRSETALELFRGQATVTLSVIEVENGKGKVAYTEDNIRATYPAKSPQDGLPNIGDSKTYFGTVDSMATEIVNRLTTHDEERK